MHISQVKLLNILGVTELEFAAGKFNEISGRNGQGKTSVLEGIKAAVQPGGHDATLLRKGADQGEVVLILDDGTSVTKRVGERSSPLEVRDADGKKQAKPADIMKQLSDMIAVNPIDFLRATKKDRARVLLEAMPLDVDVEKLAAMAGLPVGEVQPGTNALEVIDLVRKQVYDDRTGTNRAIKEKDATIKTLEQAVPDAVEGVSGSEEDMRAAVAGATEIRDKELERIRAKLDGIKTENQGKIDVIRAEVQARIDAAKAWGAEQVDAIQAAERDIEGKAGQQRELTIQRHTDTVTPINEQLAIIASNRSAAAKREQAMETIREMEDQLAELAEDAERQTKSINDIDQYKKDLLASLPIPGVEVIDGEIYRDGVVFDRLNTASQVGIAIEVAKLRAGELRCLCLDGMEIMDSATLNELRKQAEAEDFQFFITRVSDEELQVKTN